jgi:uncharacterized protein (TIGR02996 family)
MDDAFLAALAANFDDETTRLVYADWLDERGDPRGPFLRTEVEWARLHLDDEGFPAALARLSIAQRGVDLNWAMSVSRLPPLLRRTWEAGSRPLIKLPSNLSPSELRRNWIACVEHTKEMLARYAGEQAVASQFCVPADYTVFMASIGDGWLWPRGLELELFDARGVEQAVESDCEVFGEDGHFSPDDGLWLRIGGDCNKHDHLICCEFNHRKFGVVVDAHDAHPWLNGADYMTVLAPTFMHYVRDYLARLDED